VRRALLSVAVGLAGAAGVTASGWALQAGALPPPTPAARVAAEASAWFHEYRLVVDVFHVDHRRTSGACLRGWYGRADGHKVRASLLALGSGSVVRISRQRVSPVQGRPSRIVPSLLAAEAGCSRLLAGALAAAAQGGTHLTVSRSDAANRAAIALKLSRGKERRLTLYVSPRSYRPLVAIVALGEQEATARLYLTPVRRHVLTRFHLLRLAAPRPRR
jgi:hypothetical protein